MMSSNKTYVYIYVVFKKKKRDAILCILQYYNYKEIKLQKTFRHLRTQIF